MLNEAHPRFGDSVLIVGVGAVGLATIMAACNSGVTKIIAVDVHDRRLHLATDFSATHTVNFRDSDLVEEVVQTTGSTVDFAFDCTAVRTGQTPLRQAREVLHVRRARSRVADWSAPASHRRRGSSGLFGCRHGGQPLVGAGQAWRRCESTMPTGILRASMSSRVR